MYESIPYFNLNIKNEYYEFKRKIYTKEYRMG